MKSVETLQLRVHEQCRSSVEIARFLEAQPAVVRVLYPGLESHPQHELAKKQMNGGFGTVISFEVQGGQQAAFKLQDSLRLIDISNNLGDVKTMITNPWTTTQYRLPPEQRLAMGVNEGLLRLSIGLEDVKDLIRDLEAAIQSSQSLD
jgi:O-succinylhomoserine sulfhydrylase